LKNFIKDFYFTINVNFYIFILSINTGLKMTRKTKRLLFSVPFFVAMFFSMCILRLWFTVFIFFGLALLMTLIQKKRTYCYLICPLGSLQEWVYDEKKKKNRPLPQIPWIRRVLFIIFWLYLIAVLFLFHQEPFTLWSFILKLIVISSFTALLLQEFFGKRKWCSSFCPLGRILHFSIHKK